MTHGTVESSRFVQRNILSNKILLQHNNYELWHNWRKALRNLLSSSGSEINMSSRKTGKIGVLLTADSRKEKLFNQNYVSDMCSRAVDLKSTWAAGKLARSRFSLQLTPQSALALHGQTLSKQLIYLFKLNQETSRKEEHFNHWSLVKLWANNSYTTFKKN